LFGVEQPSSDAAVREIFGGISLTASSGLTG
jgi:hypothetical protein